MVEILLISGIVICLMIGIGKLLFRIRLRVTMEYYKDVVYAVTRFFRQYPDFFSNENMEFTEIEKILEITDPGEGLEMLEEEEDVDEAVIGKEIAIRFKDFEIAFTTLKDFRKQYMYLMETIKSTVEELNYYEEGFLGPKEENNFFNVLKELRVIMWKYEENVLFKNIKVNLSI